MKRKLKPGVWISLYCTVIVGIIASAFVLNNVMLSDETSKEDDLNYVSNIILGGEVPVLNETKKLIKPFTDTNVKVGKTYYDYQADSSSQEKSIIYHDNTYIQNSGVDYVSENVFDIIASLDGTVTTVKEDELVGKIVEIKHDNEYVTVYQSLSEVSVKKGDVITSGQVIGKSGTNKLDSDLGNHLHFELYISGKVVNPESYVDKEISPNEKIDNKSTTDQAKTNTNEEETTE